MNISERFEKLATYQKIEVVLLVLFFYGAIVYFYEKSLQDDTTYSAISSVKNTPQSFSNKIKKISNNEAIIFLEKNLANYQLNNSNLKSHKNSITLEVEGSFEQVINFINTIEKHMDIVSFELQPRQSDIEVKLVVEKTFLYDQFAKTSKLHFETNPFYQKQKVVLQTQEQKKFTPPKIIIDAIVADEVIYKDNWYKVGDFIEENRIISIKKDSIVLLNNLFQKEFSVRISSE